MRKKPLLLMMRMSILQLSLGLCLISGALAATVSAQVRLNKEITVKQANVRLETALQAIEKAGDFSFIYKTDVTDIKRNLSLNVTRKPLSAVLSDLLTPLSLAYEVQGDYIIIRNTAPKPAPASSGASRQDDLTIKGIVKEANGEPLPGVTVRVSGTQTAVSTSSTGTFTIKVPSESAVLIFSAIGYDRQEVTVGKQRSINLTLTQTSESLQEVVVKIAYGEQKKAKVTGSIATITTKELVQSPVSNLSNALAGRLPGLLTTQRSGEPGVDASTLYIRGLATLNGKTPLIIVDGVERSFEYLDPNDIESLSILKDAAATAPFGMRAANGVVLVTTKRGKVGAPVVSFRSSLGIQEATRLPDYLGSYDYARLRNEALVNDGSQPSFTNAQLEGYRNGSLPNTDYYKFIMQPSKVGQGNLNVSGGSQTARYFISAGYNMQEGNYKFTKNNPEGYNSNNIMQRYNLRANVDVDITPTLIARVDVAGILTNRNDPNTSAGTVMNLANRMAPIYPIFNPDGSLFGNGTFTSNIYGEVTSRGYRVFNNTTVQGTFSLTRKLDFITKNLSLKGSFSYDNTNRPSVTYGRNYAVYQPNYNNAGEIQSYTQRGENSKIDPNGSFNGGGATRTTYTELAANWNRSFGSHTLTAMALMNRQLRREDSRIPYAYQSFLGRVTYDFRSKYLVELNAAYQGSENFPTQDRYGLFPAISLGWNISEEEFIKKSAPWVSMLKLRGSYGEVGNDATSDRFLWFTSWAGADPYWFGTGAGQANGWAQGAVGNEGVTWERGRQVNVGIDAMLFKDKLGFTVDAFTQRRSDILTGRNTLSDVFGQGIKPQNIAIVDSWGMEFELNHKLKVGEVTYFIKPNMTITKNKIVYQDEVPRAYPWMVRTGNPIDTKFGLIWDGFFRDATDIANSPAQNFSAYGPGDMKYRKLTGPEYAFVQQSFDEARIGYARTPEIMFGASLGLDYKGFDFTLLLQGATNADVILNNEAAYEFFQEGKVKPFHLGRWTPETAGTATYPRLHTGAHGNNHRASSFWVRDASYLRLKNAEVGYMLPQKWVMPLGLSYFRIYANGMNLLTFDKLKDFQVDPEVGDGNGAMYPIQKIWNFGIDVHF
ncbi:TonB-dependent receptor [Pedobacter sp. SYP-B3415]|uniref:TonB-dependent receptor n=1 Tax=Pedobacter sp. SYP-B3415 TaxID=2496641 RepID=UPI00101C71B4|nr:TonB-dependent receptor [Pedobacter sp. SYP-B3415]